MSRFRIPRFSRTSARTGTGGALIHIQPEQKSHAEIRMDKVASTLAWLAVGHVKRRTSAGRDINDKPFKAYSSSYRRQLIEGGEGTLVDLTLTGGMLASVKELKRRQVGKNLVEVTIGPGGGSSQRVILKDGKAQRTGERGPPHNVVGHYLHFGRGRLKPRPWLGLSPKGREEVRRALLKRGGGVLQEKRGKPRS